jgi:proline iminopeptidase
MFGMTRRRWLAAAGVGSGVLAGGVTAARAATDVPAVSGDVHAVPSGRADAVRTGGSRTITLDSGHHVWVKQVGDGAVPVLTLHGGPGFPHFYFECFEDFLPRDRLRYWYYDQLGCGFSDHPDDASLWTVDRYRKEVEQVRAALGLERMVLYGQSWGGMLAIEYTLAYPQHVERLVISDMTASIPSYVEYVTQLYDALPADVRATMRRYEAAGDYEAPEYQQLLMANLYAKHLCRLDPWPEPVERSVDRMNAQIYNTMQGPSEFTITGNFKGWDRWADLPKIDVPTLLIVGRYDTMSVADIERMGKLIPHAQVAICENGSHLCMYDDQQAYFDALVPFLLGS